MKELSWAREELLRRLELLDAKLGEIDREIRTIEEGLKDIHPQAAVVTKYVSCGKKNCHCMEPGDRGHGPYFYLVYREHGKVITRYLGKKAPPRDGIPSQEYRRLLAQLKRLRDQREDILRRVSQAISSLEI